MPQFRKKPVVIEAVKTWEMIVHASRSWSELPEWLRSAYEAGNIVFMADKIIIKTLEGAMTADKDDWIIKGVSGELYPCKPEIFYKTYEVLVVPSVSQVEGHKVKHKENDPNRI